MAETTRDARERNITRRTTWQPVYGTQSAEEAARGCNDWINLSPGSVIQPPKIRKGNDMSDRFCSTIYIYIYNTTRMKLGKISNLSLCYIPVYTIKYYRVLLFRIIKMK